MMEIFCYAICYVLWLLDSFVCSVITCFCFEAKNEKVSIWKYIVGLFLVQLPFITIKFIFNWQPVLMGLGLIFVILSSLIYTIILYKGYLWQKVLFIVFRVTFCFMAEWMMQFLFQDLLISMEQVTFEQPTTIIYIASTEILYIILFLLFMMIWKKFVLKKGCDLKVFLLFIIFPISQIIIMSNVNFNVLTKMNSSDVSAVWGFVLGIVADVLLMILLLRQQRMQEMTVKLNEIEKVWEIEQNHYRDIEARREELAKVRHDISEQFIVMQELCHRENYEKVMEMLYTLRENVASTKESMYCADPVVNAIMAEYKRECNKKKIGLNYNLEIMQPLKMNPVVICSLFSNMMKNALTAATEVEDKEKAVIEIRASIKGDYLTVKVDNPFSEEKKKSKKNREDYGLNILQNLVDKYHGQMEVVAENGNYSTRISVENIDMQNQSADRIMKIFSKAQPTKR